MRPIALVLMLPALAMAQTPTDTDPFLWLEDVTSDQSMAWVEAHNGETLSVLEARPEFARHQQRAVDVLTATDRIAYPALRGDHVYNLWTDAANPRGLIAAATSALDASASSAPAAFTTLSDARRLEKLRFCEGDRLIGQGEA